VHEFDRHLDTELPVKKLIVNLAIQARGATRAALIDQQNVPIAVDAIKRRSDSRVKLNSALAGAARKRYQRVGLRLQIQRRNDCNP